MIGYVEVFMVKKLCLYCFGKDCKNCEEGYIDYEPDETEEMGWYDEESA